MIVCVCVQKTYRVYFEKIFLMYYSAAELCLLDFQRVLKNALKNLYFEALTSLSFGFS